MFFFKCGSVNNNHTQRRPYMTFFCKRSMHDNCMTMRTCLRHVIYLCRGGGCILIDSCIDGRLIVTQPEELATLYNREYWMIYRWPGFLAVIWFGSTPSPSPSPVSKLSPFLILPVCRRSLFVFLIFHWYKDCTVYHGDYHKPLTAGRERGWKGRGTTPRKPGPL